MRGRPKLSLEHHYKWRKEYYLKNKEKIRKERKQNYIRNIEKMREKGRQQYQKHKERFKKASHLYGKKIKNEILSHYSSPSPKCACCAESLMEFLAIDHINPKGAYGHKKGISGISLYLWIRKNGFPQGFRVLCHNCNQSLGFYGYCPHNK